MNKEEYMKLLKKRLHRLPKQDFEWAIEYFEEYFEEAGAEKEQQAIEDLGSPEEAAAQILKNIAINNSQEPVKGVKRGISAVWVGILAICAAPIGITLLLPLALMGVLLIFMVALVIVLMLMTGFVAGAMFAVSSPLSIAAGFTVIMENIPAFIICVGMGLLSAGAGVSLIYGMCILSRKVLQGSIQLIGTFLKKGGKGCA